MVRCSPSGLANAPCFDFDQLAKLGDDDVSLHQSSAERLGAALPPPMDFQ
jgi:hypothetical protein